MLTLAFDTTVNCCAVVLFEDDKEKDRFETKMEFGQAEALMVQIETLLKRRSLQFNQLDLLAVCTGPGSFTGVRSSIAAARAFALAVPSLTVCGVSAFDVYAADFKPDERAEANVVLIETKRDDFYVQYYDKDMRKTGAAGTAFYEDIIKELNGKKVSLAGDGVERFLSKPSGLSLHAIKMYDNPPVEGLARCAIAKYQQKKVDFPKPLYLKAPDVCVK